MSSPPETSAGSRRRRPAAFRALALRLAVWGGLAWEHRYGWAYEPGGMYPGPRATPTWHAGRIYFAAPDGLVGCLRADNGARLWSMNVNEQFAGRGTEFGYACSPLVEAQKVILPVGGPQASVIAVVAFVLACVVYYDMCRRLNLAVAWGFLVGFLPSWPLTVPLARLSPKYGWIGLPVFGAVLAFSLFFWTSAGCLWARAALGR